jgi:aspartyl protease family protein
MRFLLLLLVLFCLNSCSGCSKSGNRLRKISEHSKSDSKTKSSDRTQNNGKTIVKMVKNSGVYEIPTEINGIPMYFIFDTGAGIISMSNTEAGFLYKQGKLKEEDIIGTADFIDANGDISAGTIILLKTVKIGDRVLNNVEASVVDNLNAPLLMGQSALEKFGKISIDYSKSEIEFSN